MLYKIMETLFTLNTVQGDRIAYRLASLFGYQIIWNPKEAYDTWDEGEKAFVLEDKNLSVAWGLDGIVVGHGPIWFPVEFRL